MSAADPITRATSSYVYAMRYLARAGSAFEVTGRKRHVVRDMAAFAGFGLFLVWLIHIGGLS